MLKLEIFEGSRAGPRGVTFSNRLGGGGGQRPKSERSAHVGGSRSDVVMPDKVNYMAKIIIDVWQEIDKTTFVAVSYYGSRRTISPSAPGARYKNESKNTFGPV